MPVIRPRIRVSNIILRCGGEVISPACFKEANVWLTARAARQSDVTASYKITWIDGRIATGTVFLCGEVRLGTQIDDTWTRPPTMADEDYDAFIREKTSLDRSGVWPLSHTLHERPRYDVGDNRPLDDHDLPAPQRLLRDVLVHCGTVFAAETPTEEQHECARQAVAELGHELDRRRGNWLPAPEEEEDDGVTVMTYNVTVSINEDITQPPTVVLPGILLDDVASPSLRAALRQGIVDVLQGDDVNGVSLILQPAGGDSLRLISTDEE